MRIKELIEELQKQDPEREVEINTYAYDSEFDEYELQNVPIKDVKHEIHSAVIYV